MTIIFLSKKGRTSWPGLPLGSSIVTGGIWKGGGGDESLETTPSF